MLYICVGVLAAMALATCVPEAHADQCTSSHDAVLRVTSSRNATGHRITTVTLQREAKLPEPVDAVTVDVRPTTTRCRLTRMDTLEVTMHTPPPSTPNSISPPSTSPHPSPSPKPPTTQRTSPTTPLTTLPSTAPTSSITTPPPLGHEYINLPGFGNYKYHPEEKTWDEAKATCAIEGAHLLVLNSEEEVAAIQKKVTKNVRGFIWIGFHGEEDNDRHITVLGVDRSANGYERWSIYKNAEFLRKKRCGGMNSISKTLDMYYQCSYHFPFLCEQIVV